MVAGDAKEAPELALRRGQSTELGQEPALRALVTRSQEASLGLGSRGRARAIPEVVSGLSAGPSPRGCQATTAQGS